MRIHLLATRNDYWGVARLIAEGLPVDVRRYAGNYTSDDYTPLMCAVTNAHPDPDLIRLLIWCKADVNAVTYHGDDVCDTVLSLAIEHSDLPTIIALVEAGADIRSKRWGGDTALMGALTSYSLCAEHQALPVLQYLIEQGAPLDGENTHLSQHGQWSALGTASSKGWFDAVRVLLKAGGDPTDLEWTPLMHAVALGTLADVERELKAEGVDISIRDDAERTPWLLSLEVGDVAKAQRLLQAGANREDRGYEGRTPLQYAIENQHPHLLRWLLEEDFDLGMTGKFDRPPLITAIEADCIECVRILREAGAPLARYQNDALIYHATSLEMIQYLEGLGGDLSDIDCSMRRKLTGVGVYGEPDVTWAEYRDGHTPRFGTSNPQRMDIPFWREMVRCAPVSGRTARRWIEGKNRLTSDPEYDDWVWNFNRNGTFTPLPDGRFVQIAGGDNEGHGDSYIYNDVVVFDGQGDFEIYGYPREIFPPMEYHTATLVGEHIYVIGGSEEEPLTPAPVYRLHCGTWAMEKLEPGGTEPGWIENHTASYDAERHGIHISGGRVFRKAFYDADRHCVQFSNGLVLYPKAYDEERHWYSFPDGTSLTPEDAGEIAITDEQEARVYFLDLTALEWHCIVEPFHSDSWTL